MKTSQKKENVLGIQQMFTNIEYVAIGSNIINK